MSDRYNRDNHEMNAIERDRMERRRQLKRKSMITNGIVIAVIAAVIIGIIVAIVAFASGKKKSDKKADETTAVTATIASSSAVATQAPKATINPDATQPQYEPYATEAYTQETQAPLSTEGSSSQASSHNDYSSVVGSGGSDLHYRDYGRTSGGCDYTFNYDPAYVNVYCNYDYTTGIYDFNITGVSEGTTTLTLYYNIDDETQQAVPMTVYVDSNLNVTQVG